MTFFDTARLNAALNDSGMQIAELAYRIDVSISSLDRLFDGAPDPGELRLATLARLADILAIPLAAVFAVEPVPEHGEHIDPDASTDATTVIGLLYDRGAPTRTVDLATSLNWTYDRLHAAYDEADRRLRACGLVLRRSHGESVIAPLHDHDAARSALDDRHSSEHGLDLSQYKAAYQAYQEQPITVGTGGTRRRFITGALLNLGIIEGPRDKPRISPAVLRGTP